MRLFLLSLFIIIANNCFAQKTISPKKLIEDFDYAVNELKLQHQGFYQYLDKASVDIEVAALRSQLNEPMTKLEFYQLLRELIGLMNEGHGSVNLPKFTMTKVGLSKSLLPLTVQFMNKELIVTQNFGVENKAISKGAKIKSINGENIDEVTKRLFRMLATDGFNETSKYEWLNSANFSFLYRLVYGDYKSFNLKIINPNEDEVTSVSIPAIRIKQFKSKNAKLERIRVDYKRFIVQQVNDSIAYMSIPSFGRSSVDYQEFYKDAFKQFDSLNTKHLILDIQANGGGTEGNENLLFSYLSNEKIRKYKRVTMLPKPYEANKNSKSYKFDKWQFKESIAERGEFTLYSDYYSDLGYAAPDERYIYDGKLYVLISGYTFSGGAEFASLVKMTNRGIFIGEEVGGAYEGNISGYDETVTLPNSKIKINIPTVHFQIDVNPKEKGRGVMPDYVVPQTQEDYLNQKNSKLEFVKELIMN